MTALDALRTWPVGRAAAAVLHGPQVVATAGPTSERFPLASVTKVLVAIAAAIAVEEGSISYDDEAGPPAATVRHLLAHASGLDADTEVVRDAPGTRRIYSNTGFEVVGRHLEAATGLPVSRYVREALCEPLGLRGTALEGSPAHGATSTVDDLAAIVAAVLDGRLLAPGTLEAVRTPAFPQLAGVLPGFGRHDPNPWGLGVEVRGQKWPHWTARSSSPSTWGHFGRSGTFVWIDPARSCSLVVLTDREFGGWAAQAWPALSAAVLEELVP